MSSFFGLDPTPSPEPEHNTTDKHMSKKEDLRRMLSNVDEIIFETKDEQLLIEIQKLGFQYGIKWGSGDTYIQRKFPPYLTVNTRVFLFNSDIKHGPRIFVIKYNFLYIFQLWLEIKGFTKSGEEKREYKTPSMSEVIEKMTEMAELGGWKINPEWKDIFQYEEKKQEQIIEKEKEKEEKKETMPTPTNPYDSMVTDIQNRILEYLKHNLPNEEKIKNMILEECAKTQRVVHVVEDRRKVPTETRDITEPVHKAMSDLLGIIQSECWPAIVGPTGGGKTLGVLQCARILDIKLVCIKQMTRIIAPHDLIGYMDATGNYRKGAWTDAILGYEYSTWPIEKKDYPALLVVDEMDNANENIIMIIKALQTGRIAMPYGMQEVNTKLTVISTMNTWGTGATREYVGRCAQDAALLNEFQFIEWNYDTEFEWSLLQQLYKSYENPGDYQLTDIRRLLDLFIAMRAKAETQKVRVIISTRNIINVTKMLMSNAGWPIHKALCMSVYKGLKEEEIKRIECPEHWRAPQASPKKRVIDLDNPDMSIVPKTKKSLLQEQLDKIKDLKEEKGDCPI